MPTITRPGRRGKKEPKKPQARRRRGPTLPLIEDIQPALSRSTSLDTLATAVPRRTRLMPVSGPRPSAEIEIDLPEGTVVRLLVLNEMNDVVDTLVDGWLPAGAHRLCDLCLPNGAYKLRLETPNAWHVAGLMIG